MVENWPFLYFFISSVLMAKELGTLKKTCSIWNKFNGSKGST
jgi:hypothetical protein